MGADPYRVYADTSVFGGVFDDEFRDASKAFFDQVDEGRFILVTSALVQQELRMAKEEVRALFDAMLPEAEIADITDSALALQDSYLSAGILSDRWATDALHVALGTLAKCRMIVSWNFKHIVHFDKIRLYNIINADNGHGTIDIYSPLEVIGYEDEDV